MHGRKPPAQPKKTDIANRLIWTLVVLFAIALFVDQVLGVHFIQWPEPLDAQTRWRERG